jgi:hypothetical protein
LAVLLALAIPTSAVMAQSQTISGHLHHDGTLTQFNTWRTHTNAGTIDGNISNLPNGGGWLRLGLRNPAGTQFTQSTQWDSTGLKSFLLPNGSNWIPAQTFALNGRMAACGIFCDDDFGGVLSY